MVVHFDDNTGLIVISDDYCDEGHQLYDTGCGAPGCNARCCMDCGTGCDIEFAPTDGECARATAAESDEDYEARVNRERSAFGLSPITRDGA